MSQKSLSDADRRLYVPNQGIARQSRESSQEAIAGKSKSEDENAEPKNKHPKEQD